MKITVLGSGAWGTALAMLLSENGHAVTLWTHRAEGAAAMRQTRENPLLAGVRLPEALAFTADMQCLRDSGAVVFATPSFAVRETAAQAAGFLAPGTQLISVSKGIEKDTSLTLTQVIAEETGGSCPLTALSGPSHAEEVARRIPTAVTAASADAGAAETVQALFMNERFRVYTSSDILGVQIAAAFKNIIALCAGCCDGMGLGDNTKAALMTRGLAEIARLGEALGGCKETFAGLAGVGDLIVTCTSMHSRNRRCGILIGQGTEPKAAVAEIGAVVEGYYAAANAKTLADRHDVEMPILEGAHQVLYCGADPHSIVERLMTRPGRCELEASWL